LREAVLVVGATASRQPVVSFAAVAAALDARDGRPLVLLDVALPRDIDPRARELHRATLIDLDDLERLCPVDAHDRSAERRRAEALAAEEADRLADWLRFRAVSPAIAELRGYAETIRKGELRRSATRLRDLTPEQIAAVEALTAGIVNKLMHGPTVALRDAASRPGGLRRSRSRILRVLRPPPRKAAAGVDPGPRPVSRGAPAPLAAQRDAAANGPRDAPIGRQPDLSGVRCAGGRCR